MGRRDDGPAVSRVMKELDTDGSGDVDIQEFEAWYRKQEDQKLGGGGLKMPVCIDSPGEYGWELSGVGLERSTFSLMIWKVVPSPTGW